MSLSHVKAVLGIALKELRTSFRDRQTTIYALVLPICMYPIVFWVMIQGVLVIQGKKERTEVTVGLVAETPERITQRLEDVLEARDEDPEPPDDEAVSSPLEAEGRINVVALEKRASAGDAESARAWLAEDDAPHAVLFLPTPVGTDEEAPENRAQLFYDSTNSRSDTARKRVAARLPGLVSELRADRARERGHDPAELAPLTVREHDIAPIEDKGALILSLMLPMLLVFMSVMGAFFPAVDLTAGEKERKTAETTLLLPIPRHAIHQGKILAVATTAAIATFLNLVAIGLSAEHLLASLTRATSLRIELPVGALFSIVPLAVLFTFFVSAVLTGFAGLAASFKEGQALLGPVQMVFILPAMAGALPGLELTTGTAFIPVINVVLAFRSMLLEQGLYVEYALTAAALLIYSSVAIACAVKLLSQETVVLSGKTISFRRLFSMLRSS